MGLFDIKHVRDQSVLGQMFDLMSNLLHLTGLPRKIVDITLSLRSGGPRPSRTNWKAVTMAFLPMAAEVL